MTCCLAASVASLTILAWSSSMNSVCVTMKSFTVVEIASMFASSAATSSSCRRYEFTVSLQERHWPTRVLPDDDADDLGARDSAGGAPFSS